MNRERWLPPDPVFLNREKKNGSKIKKNVLKYFKSFLRRQLSQNIILIKFCSANNILYQNALWTNLAIFRHLDLSKKAFNNFWGFIFWNLSKFSIYFGPLCYCANFRCCKWQNTERIIKPLDHTSTLSIWLKRYHYLTKVCRFLNDFGKLLTKIPILSISIRPHYLLNRIS